VNIAEKATAFGFDLTPERYPISASATYRVARIDESGGRWNPLRSRGKLAYRGKINARDVLLLEIRREHNASGG